MNKLGNSSPTIIAFLSSLPTVCYINYSHTYMHVYIHTYIHAYVHTYIHYNLIALLHIRHCILLLKCMHNAIENIIAHKCWLPARLLIPCVTPSVQVLASFSPLSRRLSRPPAAICAKPASRPQKLRLSRKLVEKNIRLSRRENCGLNTKTSILI